MRDRILREVIQGSDIISCSVRSQRRGTPGEVDEYPYFYGLTREMTPGWRYQPGVICLLIERYACLKAETFEIEQTVSVQDEINGIVNCCSGKPISIRTLVEERMKEKAKLLFACVGVF